MKITWLGTASILLEAGGERILFDPFVERRGGENPNSLKDFLGEETIFVTHGHFDHLSVVPLLLEQGEATVFCTDRPAQTLEELLEEFSPETGRILIIHPGDTFAIGECSIKVLCGKHITFKLSKIFDTLSPLRLFRYFYNLPFLFYANRKFQEGNETVAFDIQAEEKEILLLGSLALEERENYPSGVDLLILPFQGNHDLEAEALKIVRRIRPKRIMLSHFDNAFPPISRCVDTRLFKKLMDERFPEIQVIKPVAGKTYHFGCIPA